MCAKSKAPPPPQAPPAPTPVRDSKIEATQARQQAARRASASGYSATMLTGPGGVGDDAPVTAATLGG
jgi:hypothetical protein